MDLIEKIEKIYKMEENDFISKSTTEEIKYIALYAMYHYFNADVTKIEELNSGFYEKTENMTSTGTSNYNYPLFAIFENSIMDTDAIDFIFSISSGDFSKFIKSSFNNILFNFGQIVEDIIIKNKNSFNSNAIDVYNTLNRKTDDNTLFVIKILCPVTLDNDDKFIIQQKISEFSYENEMISYEIIFLDDLEQEIEDVESPKEFVPKGSLTLCNPESICYFGEEKSFITVITAKSLKKNYLQYGTHGLLASNLRYFVSSKKIDPKIIDTIKNDGENFVYFNNGIIVTCDNYRIKGTNLELQNFSIVNGGQTTNLIGRTLFDKDFTVICKVIKNKYNVEEERIEFLSKVAEASNTQKPINAKDLIANKKEQRMLKLQFANAGIFLKVKRGEKIDLSQYKEKWQNASNDEIAQMIYSCVFQSPGTSKNSKSKILETDKIYNKIFMNKYSNEFFISLQKLKIAYNDYQKKLKKTIVKSSFKYGLSKHANLMSISVICLLYKFFTNKELYKYVNTLPDININNNNYKFKEMLSQNDIGNLKLIKDYLHNMITKTTFDSVFNKIFEKILVPAYDLFKIDYPTYSYSNFFKTDLYYYNYVVLITCRILKDPYGYKEIHKLFDPFFELSQDAKSIVVKDETKTLNFASLSEELREYKKNIHTKSGGKIEAYKVITDMQIASIIKYKPKTIEDLYKKVNMKRNQIDEYGAEILCIIKKHY